MATLCRTLDECGMIANVCGSDAATPLARDDPTTVCVGFQGPSDTGGGQKAIFNVKVDHYATLSVDSLRTLMGAASFADKEPFSRMWVGLNGRRTVGQQRGHRNAL